nr:Hachiman antiphage defense system protein HamA [Flavobacterium sp. 1]
MPRSDSVHVVVKDGDFTLWYGEAKFYNDIQTHD